ncbi:hypothetical protein FRC03_008891 [Tulasnella sp. 419]|nr:hypothetical protein FRC03_008891 [Tulasnella sp. 419]
MDSLPVDLFDMSGRLEAGQRLLKHPPPQLGASDNEKWNSPNVSYYFRTEPLWRNGSAWYGVVVTFRMPPRPGRQEPEDFNAGIILDHWWDPSRPSKLGRSFHYANVWKAILMKWVRMGFVSMYFSA